MTLASAKAIPSAVLWSSFRTMTREESPSPLELTSWARSFVGINGASVIRRRWRVVAFADLVMTGEAVCAAGAKKASAAEGTPCAPKF
jgi:hypothetical protein